MKTNAVVKHQLLNICVTSVYDMQQEEQSLMMSSPLTTLQGNAPSICIALSLGSTPNPNNTGGQGTLWRHSACSPCARVSFFQLLRFSPPNSVPWDYG